jgi:hypothetical protein
MIYSFFFSVPQSLVAFGILRYSSELTRKLEQKILLSSGDRLEQEIRAASIWAVEKLRQCMITLHATKQSTTNTSPTMMPINAILLDFYLWDYAKAHPDALRHIPIHRTRSIFY